MLNKEHSKKIIDKIEPLIKKGIAVLDLEKNILAESDDFMEVFHNRTGSSDFDKKKLNISEKGIPISRGSKNIGYLYVEEKPEKVKDMKKVLPTR